MTVPAGSTHTGATRPHARPPAPPRRGWATAVALVVVALLLLVAIIPFAAAAHVVRMSTSHVDTPTDAVVVLGAAQFNGVPSPVFANRLDHAKELYDAGVAPTIITVGGKQPGDAFTEAEAGQAYLIDSGVPAADIVAVPTGEDTLTSLTAVAEQMAELGMREVTLVSDPTHMARSLAMADRLGMVAYPNGTNGGDGNNVTAVYVARETVGYLHFVFVGQWPVDRVIPSEVN